MSADSSLPGSVDPPSNLRTYPLAWVDIYSPKPGEWIPYHVCCGLGDDFPGAKRNLIWLRLCPADADVFNRAPENWVWELVGKDEIPADQRDRLRDLFITPLRPKLAEILDRHVFDGAKGGVVLRHQAVLARHSDLEVLSCRLLVDGGCRVRFVDQGSTVPRELHLNSIMCWGEDNVIENRTSDQRLDISLEDRAVASVDGPGCIVCGKGAELRARVGHGLCKVRAMAGARVHLEATDRGLAEASTFFPSEITVRDGLLSLDWGDTPGRFEALGQSHVRGENLRGDLRDLSTLELTGDGEIDVHDDARVFLCDPFSRARINGGRAVTIDCVREAEPDWRDAGLYAQFDHGVFPVEVFDDAPDSVQIVPAEGGRRPGLVCGLDQVKRLFVVRNWLRIGGSNYPIDFRSGAERRYLITTHDAALAKRFGWNACDPVTYRGEIPGSLCERIWRSEVPLFITGGRLSPLLLRRVGSSR